MFKKRFMPLALASLLALVGCGSSPAGPFATEENQVKSCVSEFFGESALKNVQVGEDVVYAGQDKETGEDVYYDGAAYDVEDFDRVIGGVTKTFKGEDYLKYIGYQVPVGSTDKEEPMISKIALDLRLTNMTAAYMDDEEDLPYIKHEGGQEYYYKVEDIEIEGIPLERSTLLALYISPVLDGEDLLGMYMLEIQFTVLYIAKENVTALFGADAKTILNRGKFDENNKIHFAMESISSSYIDYTKQAEE